MPTRHTFQYGDVLIGQVVIEELNFVRPVSVLNKEASNSDLPRNIETV